MKEYGKLVDLCVLDVIYPYDEFPVLKPEPYLLTITNI